MNFLGIWPSSRCSGGVNLNLLVPSSLMSVFVLLPPMISVVRVWGDIIRVAAYLSTTIIAVTGLSKILITRYYREVLQTVISSMRNDWLNSNDKSKYEIITKTARKARILTLRCWCCTTMLGLFYVSTQIAAFISTREKSKRFLIYPTYFPFDVQKSPIYEIVFGCQLLGGLYCGVVYSTIDSFISTLIIHISGQYVILRHVIKHIESEASGASHAVTDFRERLSAIVKRHEHLNWLAITVDSCYNTLLLGQLLGATFQLCFEVFQAYTILTEGRTYLTILKLLFLTVYAAHIIVHLYIYCRAGEDLHEHSTNISCGVYECNWYNLSPKDARSLMLIAYRSTVPLRLNAGKFSIFSLQLFGAAMKTSMGYVSVLLTVKNRID